MTRVDAQFVDRIVREVMRRLALMPAVTASPAAAEPVTLPPVPVPPPPAAAPLPAGTVVLRERIVAMAQLEGILHRVQRLIVRSDAIVTPAARDLLKEKQIPWERSVGELAGQAAVGLLAAAEGTLPAQRWADALASDGLQWQVCRDVDQVVRGLQRDGSARPTLALVLTAGWASLVCQANRHSNIRAVAVTDSTSLQQACGQLEVNLLVLDPTRLAESEILTLARTYLQRCVRGAIKA